MLRKLSLFIAFLVIVQLARAQEPCDISFDLFGADTACAGAPGFFLPPVFPFGGVYSGEGVSPDGFFDTSVLLPGIYEVTYTADTAVCIGSGSATIVVQNPTPFTIAGFTTVCEGDSTVISSVEGYELQWDDGSKSFTRVFYPDSTLITFAVYTDSAGCSFVQNFTIYLEDFSRMEIVAQQQICYGQEIAIDINNVTGVTWCIDLSQNTNIVTSFTQDTVLQLKIRSNGCDSLVHYPIEVADSLVFDFITDTTLCPGQMAMALGVGNALNYRFDGYGDFTDTLEFELSDDALIFATAEGEFGCNAYRLINYIMDDFPPLEVTFPDSICETFPYEIFASGAFEYVWIDDATGDTLYTGLEQDVQLIAEQSLDWSITGFSQYGCSVTEQVDVYVDATPEVRIDTLTALCIDRPLRLLASGAFSYTWSTGLVGDTLEIVSSVDTILSVIGVTSIGCINYDTLNVTVNEVPVVTAIGENSICEGDTATVVGLGAIRFVWEGILEGDTVQLTPIVDSAVSFIGYNVYGCSDFSVFNINVDPAPIVDFIGSSFICDGDSSSLEVQTNGTFEWAGGNTEAVIPVEPSDDTTYVIFAIAPNGCPRTASFNVAVYAYPDLSISGETSVCFGDSLSLSAIGADEVYWSNGFTGASITMMPVGSQTLLAYGVGEGGCTTVFPFAIQVNPTPQVQFAFNADTLCRSGSGIGWTASPFGGTLSGDGIFGNWFDLALANDGLNVVTYSYVNEFNCSASAVDEIIVESCTDMNDYESVHLAAYPNPCYDLLRIEGSELSSYRLLDDRGGVVVEGTLTGSGQIDMRQFAPGIYILEVPNSSAMRKIRVVKLH